MKKFLNLKRNFVSVASNLKTDEDFVLLFEIFFKNFNI